MFITYELKTRRNLKLQQAIQQACNFWNHFIIPSKIHVVVVGVFTNWASSTTGKSGMAKEHNNQMYSHVRLNWKFLRNWTVEQTAATLAHEIGHSLGIGWSKWDELYDQRTGQFRPEAISQVPALANMSVELEHGEMQRYSHWDEERFDQELMTPFKDRVTYVLPATIDVMELLGHQIRNRLPARTPLSELLQLAEQPALVSMAKSSDIDRSFMPDTLSWNPGRIERPAASHP